MNRTSSTDDRLPRLEDEIRKALRARAATTPVGSVRSPHDVVVTALPDRRRRGRTVVAIGTVAGAAAVVAAALLVAAPDDGTVSTDRDRSPALSQPDQDAGATPTLPPADVPRLVLDVPGFAVLERYETGPGPATAETGESPGAREKTLQTFRRPGHAGGTMLFLSTLRPHDPATFGLVGDDSGDPVTVRGVTGYAASYNGPNGSIVVSAKLPDGVAVYLIAAGVDRAEAVRFLDGLTPRADGGWDATVLPGGVVEAEASTPANNWWSYEVGIDVDLDGEGDGDVNLYPDPFDGRLADRVASTTGPVEAVEVAGFPALMGPYSPTDWWVMLEPAPGRTVELRLRVDRDELLRLLATARFVDEVTWDALVEAS